MTAFTNRQRGRLPARPCHTDVHAGPQTALRRSGASLRPSGEDQGSRSKHWENWCSGQHCSPAAMSYAVSFASRSGIAVLVSTDLGRAAPRVFGSAQPPDLPSAVLMELGSRLFAPSSPAVGLCIRFLFIGSRLCSTLLSDPASRRTPVHFTNP